MGKLHVLLKKEELDQERLEGKVVVVLDVLFATSSIVTALEHGARRVVPKGNGEEALEEATRHEAGSYLLSGELNADTLAGFAHPTPLALLEQDLGDRTLIYCTTNGTVALAKARQAEHIYAAALLNGAAVVEHIASRHADQTVLLVCSGSADNFNLEDFYGAGYLVSLFRQGGTPFEYSDAALAAEMLHAGTEAESCLARSRVGRMMASRRLEAEIGFAAQKSIYRIVPRLVDGSLSG